MASADRFERPQQQEDVTRLEVERSSPVSHRRSRRMIAAQANGQCERDKTLPEAVQPPKEHDGHVSDVTHSSRCSIPSLETFASVISSGIQSGELSGAVSSHAHPSYLCTLSVPFSRSSSETRSAAGSEEAGSSRRAALRAACRGVLPEKTLSSVPSASRSAKFRLPSSRTMVCLSMPTEDMHLYKYI